MQQQGGGGGGYNNKPYVIPGLGRTPNTGPPKYRRNAAPKPKPKPRPKPGPPVYNKSYAAKPHKTTQAEETNARRRASVRSTVAKPKPAPKVVIRPPAVGPPPVVGKSPTGQVLPTSSSRTTSSTGTRTAGGVKATGIKAPAGPPNVNAYLKADPAYIAQESALKRALADFTAGQTTAGTQYQGQYDLNNKDLAKQKGTGFSDLANDYASRGIIQSGVYGKAFSDLGNEFTGRQTALDTGKANFTANQGVEKRMFGSEQADTLERAKQAAVARRAAKYGL